MRHKSVLLVSTIMAGACGLGVIGNGEVTSTSRPLTGFSHVTAAGSGDVHVREGGAYSVSVTTDSNLQPLIETRVSGDTLVIDAHDLFRPTELRIDVQLPTFRGGTLSGSGAFDAVVTSIHDLDLTLDGSGTLETTGEARAIAATLSGSGIVRLTGAAESLAALMTRSGLLDARDLTADQATLSLAGSGGVKATVVRSVALDLEGSGDIDWWGPAAVSSASVGGSGQIVHH